MAQRRSMGFTLVELMAVVAIIGVLSALGLFSIVTFTRTARINGSSGVLTRSIADARLRSMTQRCPHIVHVNGRSYNVAGAPGYASSISMVRKANCNSGNIFFEAGDLIIDTTSLGDLARDLRLEVNAPLGRVAGNWLDNSAVSIGYTPAGARTVSWDATATGTFTPDGALGTGNIDLRFGYPSGPTSDYVTLVRVPNAGSAFRY